MQTRFNTQIYEEASHWFVQCRAGDLDDGSRRELDRWLRTSPEHVSAYLEIAAIWNNGPSVDSAHKWNSDTLICQATEDPDNIATLISVTHSEPTRPAPPQRWRVFAVAASLVTLTLVATAAWFTLLRAPVYRTETGEQRSFTLADGSTVELDTRSKIRVRYSNHLRAIELLEGQALFHVTKDVARPFVVASDEMRARAVGTQFNVYRKLSGTVVTVVEGRVAVLNATDDPASAAPTGSLMLAAGEQAVVTHQAARKADHPNFTGATAWTRRQLIFDSAALSEVAEEFNRYNSRQLVIDPSALGNIHISGVFSSTDPTALIRFLRLRPGARVIETPAEIRIEKEISPKR
jgi:transmembrane sensor